MANEANYYSAEMSNGSNRLIGDMEDVKNFLKMASKQEKGLIITKYGVLNPAFIVSIGLNYSWCDKAIPPQTFMLEFKEDIKQITDNKKLLN